MPAGQCASLAGEVTGTGQRNETIDTLMKLDGSSHVVINDLVVGTAQSSNGDKYNFYYINHSTWNSPASGTPVAIRWTTCSCCNPKAAPPATAMW